MILKGPGWIKLKDLRNRRACSIYMNAVIIAAMYILVLSITSGLDMAALRQDGMTL